MYFQNFDQVSGKRDGISSKNNTQVGVEEELLLSDWDKNELPEKKILTVKHLVPINRIRKINQETLSPCVHVGISKYEGA